MKRQLFGLALVVVSAMTFVGCGNPKIPANAVAAWYVDLDKSLDNVQDVAELIVSNMPKDCRDWAEKQLEEGVELYKKNYRQFDFDWAVLTVGKGDGSDSFESALVVKCDYGEKGDSGTAIDILAGVLGAVPEKKWDCEVLLGYSYNIAFVGGSYVIASDSVEVLRKMVALYKDGEGDTSDSFDELTDIDGDTVARFQTVDVETAADLYGVRKVLEDFGKECDDEDLVDDILDIGGLTLDVAFSDDTVGFRLEIDAGSREFARCLEGLCLLGKILGRTSADGIACFKSYVARFSGFMPYEVRRNVSLVKQLDGDSAKELSGMLRNAVEVDRSGSTVEVTFTLDVDDLAEVIVPAACK